MVKSHGSANAKGVANAVAVAARLLEEDLIERIKADLAESGLAAKGKARRASAPAEEA